MRFSPLLLLPLLSALTTAIPIASEPDSSLGPVTRLPIPSPFICGCTNDCRINCAKSGKADCICPAYCDPKYECRVVARAAEPEAAAEPATPTRTLTPGAAITRVPVKPKESCTTRCTNDCIENCKSLKCICPMYCDPKYNLC